MPRRPTPEENARIEAAVLAVESRTGADLSVLVTPVSDRYGLFPMVWAAAGALLAALAAAFLWPDLSIGAAIEIQVPVFVALTLIFDWLSIRLLLVPAHLKQHHARALAHRAFAAHLSGGAPGQSHVLLFVSLGERYVEILADHATHQRVAEGTWDAIVAEFVGKMRAGKGVDGILAAVASCGAALEKSSLKPAQ
ncbi:MAG TPA: hypothetical protein VMU85_03270 [Stellaceae bacterium]|nr:hypothetical protein [Stellaceae bacterium]